MAGRTNEEMTGAEMVLKALAEPGCRGDVRLSGRRGAADYDRFPAGTRCATFSCATSRCSARGRRLRPLDRKARRPARDLGARRHQRGDRPDNALMDSTPLVCITGQVPTHLIGNDAFQECDTVGITRPCTKHNYLVKERQRSSRASCTRRSMSRPPAAGAGGGDIPRTCSSRAANMWSEQHPA